MRETKGKDLVEKDLAVSLFLLEIPVVISARCGELTSDRKSEKKADR